MTDFPRNIPNAGASPLVVTFSDVPGTFVDVEGCQSIWKHPDRRRIGVYLWCIGYEDRWLVNYVGKTSCSTGFEGRLWTEFTDWKAGRYCTPVDVEAFKRGRRIPVDAYDRYVEHQLIHLAPLYRGFLAPLPCDADCRHVESWIVNQLRQQASAFQFLGNRDKERAYRPKPSPAVHFAGSTPIIGITSPVPESLHNLLR